MSAWADVYESSTVVGESFHREISILLLFVVVIYSQAYFITHHEIPTNTASYFSGSTNVNSLTPFLQNPQGRNVFSSNLHLK